ncbi:hypothetical protein Tco_0497495 [Tanacetum coccineum]
MHHSKRQNRRFLLVMLRLELHKASVLAVGKLTLEFFPDYNSCFSGRCPILNCFNLGGVNVNSSTVNYVPKKLHGSVPAFLKEANFVRCRATGGAPDIQINLKFFFFYLGLVVSSVIGGILSIEARDMDTKLLSALESNNTLARCLTQSLILVVKLLLAGWPLFLQSWSGDRLLAVDT